MNLETAVEQLYTDESLAADVDDKTAGPLLKWAESVLPALLSRGDAGFDDAFVTLRKLIKSIARLIDLRGELDMDERAERASRIQALAQELGIEVNIGHLEALATFDGPELVAQIVGGAEVQQPVPAADAVVSRETVGDTSISPVPKDEVVAGQPEQLALPAPDEAEEQSEHPMRGSIGEFFRRVAESLDADPEPPDTKE